MMGLNLTKVEKRQVAIVQDELRPWGVTHWVERGGKHLAVRVVDREGSLHRIVLSCTPKDRDHSLDHARQKARRLLRLINGRAGY